MRIPGLPIGLWLVPSCLFAANYVVNYLPIMRTLPLLSGNRLAYFALVVMPAGIILPLWLMPETAMRLVRKRHWTISLVAIALSLAFAAAGVGKIALDAPMRSMNLFIWLLMSSIVEVLVFLVLLFGTVRAMAAERISPVLAAILATAVSCILFGAYHFTYSPPWNTAQLAVTVSIVWIFVSATYIATGRFWTTVFVNNVMATTGFLRNGIGYLDGEPLLLGIVLDIFLVGVLLAWWHLIPAKRHSMA